MFPFKSSIEARTTKLAPTFRARMWPEPCGQCKPRAATLESLQLAIPHQERKYVVSQISIDPPRLLRTKTPKHFRGPTPYNGINSSYSRQGWSNVWLDSSGVAAALERAMMTLGPVANIEGLASLGMSFTCFPLLPTHTSQCNFRGK